MMPNESQVYLSQGFKCWCTESCLILVVPWHNICVLTPSSVNNLFSLAFVYVDCSNIIFINDDIVSIRRYLASTVQNGGGYGLHWWALKSFLFIHLYSSIWDQESVYMCIILWTLKQARVVEMHTDLKVGKFWGEMGVDFWNAAIWKEKLDQYEVAGFSLMFLDPFDCFFFLFVYVD